jgi:NAD(P)-dependent dehydrogenase (short-subunit alcohol dehydrogenase family)
MGAMERFAGLTALVTGGASGIGAATARRLAAEGAVVVVGDVDDVGAKAVAGEVDGRAVPLDVTDAASVTEAFAEAGPVDVLVNNAGGDRVALFVDTDPATWEATLALNLRGTMACTLAAYPGMVERRRGAIVNVASEAGRVGTVGGAAYSAAKAGVLGFTKAIAREGAPFGVRCNAVAPGPVETPMLEDTAAADRLGAKVVQAMVDATLLRRRGRPEEVAAAIAYLASDDASYVTGHTLAVSGGLALV